MNGECWHCGSTEHDTGSHPGRYKGGAVDGPYPGRRFLRLTPVQARALSSLVGQYQDYLESEIACEVVNGTDQPDPADPDACRRVQRARRRWRKCEEFVTILSPGGPIENL